MKNQTKAKLFDIRLLHMDLGRIPLIAVLPLYRLKVLTPEGKPCRRFIRGGGIIAANHSGFLDPLVLFRTIWYRRLFFLAADVVMGNPVQRALLKGIGAIEINRDIADMQAVRHTVKRLKEGHVVGVFPEGQITRTEEISSIKSGVVLMALQADVPIYPMHIYPRKKWYHTRIAVLGEPFYPSKYCKKKIPTTADIQTVSNILVEKMNECTIREAVK